MTWGNQVFFGIILSNFLASACTRWDFPPSTQEKEIFRGNSIFFRKRKFSIFSFIINDIFSEIRRDRENRTTA